MLFTNITTIPGTLFKKCFEWWLYYWYSKVLSYEHYLDLLQLFSEKIMHNAHIMFIPGISCSTRNEIKDEIHFPIYRETKWCSSPILYSYICYSNLIQQGDNYMSVNVNKIQLNLEYCSLDHVQSQEQPSAVWSCKHGASFDWIIHDVCIQYVDYDWIFKKTNNVYTVWSSCV